ncbi:hypothetical protein ABW21_db0203780 [Orbilia brochopaga]|nr:hypothetical protein ABW21_db0203780 [Drechslerella brochopaga]
MTTLAGCISNALTMHPTGCPGHFSLLPFLLPSQSLHHPPSSFLRRQPSILYISKHVLLTSRPHAYSRCRANLPHDDTSQTGYLHPSPWALLHARSLHLPVSLMGAHIYYHFIHISDAASAFLPRILVGFMVLLAFIHRTSLPHIVVLETNLSDISTCA